MDVYSQIATNIVKSQETIIGPVALEQAKAVPGIKVGSDKSVSVVGDNGAFVIDELVEKYKELFGQISVEVCKEAAGSLIDKLPEDKHPKSLE